MSRVIILFIMFIMNLLCGLSLVSTYLVTKPIYTYFYAVHENFLYFCITTLIFNIISLFILVRK